MAVVSDVTVRLRIDARDLQKGLSAITDSANTKGLQDGLSGVQDQLTGIGKNVGLSTMSNGLNQVSGEMMKVADVVTDFGKESFNSFINFERGLSKVSAMGGITGDNLKALEQTAMDLGATTEFTSTEVVDAFQSMALAGWKQKDMLAGIGGALDLATISGLDFGQVTGYLINALTPFNMTAEESSKVVDILAKTATSANFNVNDLAKSFEYVAPIAGAMGYSVEETSTALALLANNGLKGSKAGTALRKMLTDLNSPTSEATKVMTELGIEMANTDGSMRPLMEVLKETSIKFAGLTAEQKAQYAETLTGKTGMAGFLAIMNGGPEKIDAMTASVNDFEGAGAKMADTIRSDTMGSVDELASAWDNFKIKIGGTVSEYLEPVITKLTDMAMSLGNLSEPAKQAIVMIGGAIVVLAVLTAVVAGAMGAWLLFTGVLLPIIAPIAMVVGAIMGVVGVLMYFWNTSESFRNAVMNIWNAIKDDITNACNTIQELWDKWGDHLMTYIKNIFDMIRIAIETVLNVIAGVIRTVTSLIKGDWTGVWNGIKEIVVSIFNGVVNFLTSCLNSLFSIFGSVLSSILNVVVDKFKSVYDFMCNPVENAKNAIKNMIESIKSFFNFQWAFPKLAMPHFSVSGSMNPLKWIDEGVPKISVDWYAKGGIFSGPQVIGVGESGDEAVVPLSNRTKVKPFAQAVANEMGGSAGGGLTINVGELVVREEADIRKVAQELYRLQQYKSRGKGF